MFDERCQTVSFTTIMQSGRAFVPTVGYGQTAPEEPVQDDAYARGLADGQEIAAATFEADRIAMQQLVASANALQPEANDEVAALMSKSVLRLVEQIVGDVTIDAAFLEQQIALAMALTTEADAARTMWLNPADHALMADIDLGLTKKIDPQLARGNLRIDCSDSWIEHGSAIGIQKLHYLLGNKGTDQ